MIVRYHHRITYYLDGRLYEWTFSAACLALGLGILVWPRMVHGSIVRVLVDLVSGDGAALIFFAVGVASIAALIVNGNSKRIGPRVRSICAIARAVLWGQFTLSMTYVSVAQGFPSPMVFFFTIFTMSELYVVYRAVLDVRVD